MRFLRDYLHVLGKYKTFWAIVGGKVYYMNIYTVLDTVWDFALNWESIYVYILPWTMIIFFFFPLSGKLLFNLKLVSVSLNGLDLHIPYQANDEDLD